MYCVQQLHGLGGGRPDLGYQIGVGCGPGTLGESQLGQPRDPELQALLAELRPTQTLKTPCCICSM